MAEQALHSSGGDGRADWYLAAVVESSEDAIVSKSLEGIITSWNPAAERIFGYTAAEAIGRPISMIVPPELGAEEPMILGRICSGEKIRHFETTRLRKDGRRIQVSLTISPVRDETGRIIGASKIARDISDRKIEQEKIRIERDRLHVTLSSIGDGVIVTDARGYVEFLNPIAEGLTGWKQAEAKGRPLDAVFSIINETSRHRVENPVVKAIRDGLVVGLANHTLLITREGSEIAIDDSAAPIRDGAGTIHGVVLVFRDVTGPRAIDRIRSTLSAIVEGSDDAIISKDLQGRITSWNKGAEAIFGYSQQEALGRSITMLIPPDRLDEETEIINRLLRGERLDHFETVRLAKDRRKVDVSLTISPIRDSHGEIIGASKIARDITGKKRTERELQEAHALLKQRADELQATVAARTAELQETLDELETFSSSLSHDLKGPLRAICGFAYALHEDHAAQLPEEGQIMLKRLTDTCHRLGRLVENVLSYSRLRKNEVRLERVELDTLVPRVLLDNPHARQANAEVLIERPLMVVQGNDPLLTQSIANLISNGVKFVLPGIRPRLRIWTERNGDMVRLWVEDNGIGIAKGDQRKVFELFTRLHGSQAYEGTGVGLALVQRAVSRMGGMSGVESEPGKGSRFWIELKAVQSQEQSQAAA